MIEVVQIQFPNFILSMTLIKLLNKHKSDFANPNQSDIKLNILTKLSINYRRSLTKKNILLRATMGSLSLLNMRRDNLLGQIDRRAWIIKWLTTICKAWMMDIIITTINMMNLLDLSVFLIKGAST